MRQPCDSSSGGILRETGLTKPIHLVVLSIPPSPSHSTAWTWQLQKQYDDKPLELQVPGESYLFVPQSPEIIISASADEKNDVSDDEDDIVPFVVLIVAVVVVIVAVLLVLLAIKQVRPMFSVRGPSYE